MKSSIICRNCGKIFKGEKCPKCGTYPKSIEEINMEKEEMKIKKEEREQKYQNKIDERGKINEDYGFTDDEIFRIYHIESKQADKVYKAFVTGGVSRLEKVNGRFLASQLRKLDVLSQQNNRIIQQNDEIIGLLKEIAENTK